MERCADLSTQSEIDDAILDYLLYTAMKALLEDSRSREHDRHGEGISPQLDLPLQMVDSFLVMFYAMYPDRLGSEELRFRLRLVEFTRLFTTRTTPLSTSLPKPASGPAVHQDQKHQNTFPNSDKASGDPEASAFPTADKLSTTDLPETLPSLSLLTTLPPFMALSAAHISLQDTRITPVWMRLAAGYMAHAAIEQSLIHAAAWPEVLHRAFAYGFDANLHAEEESDEWAINAMFFDEDGVVAGWEEIRKEHVDALSSGPGVDLRGHLEGLLAEELPLATFEDDVVRFLRDLLFAHPKPFLVQVEEGKVAGLSRKETTVLKDEVRWEGY